ncbi:hypothetical protein YSY22_52510 [Brevibacillus formosus]
MPFSFVQNLHGPFFFLPIFSTHTVIDVISRQIATIFFKMKSTVSWNLRDDLHEFDLGDSQARHNEK